MFMRFKIVLALSLLIGLIATSCSKSGFEVVIYQTYCKGCVITNFGILGEIKDTEEFSLYFDTTDIFLRSEANLNGLEYFHMENEDIPSRFGDFSNVVVQSSIGTFELKTNEKIEKGVHYN